MQPLLPDHFRRNIERCAVIDVAAVAAHTTANLGYVTIPTRNMIALSISSPEGFEEFKTSLGFREVETRPALGVHARGHAKVGELDCGVELVHRGLDLVHSRPTIQVARGGARGVFYNPVCLHIHHLT